MDILWEAGNRLWSHRILLFFIHHVHDMNGLTTTID